MSKKRLRNNTWDDYGISRNRYQELKAFCLQYDEKRSKIKRGISSCVNDGMPKGNYRENPLESNAIRNVQYQKDCEMIKTSPFHISPYTRYRPFEGGNFIRHNRATHTVSAHRKVNAM